MRYPLRILSIEDDPKDAKLIQDLLESEDIACEVTRVDTQAALRASLEPGRIDLILADYTLPSFDGLSALKLAMKACPEVPFIFVSGTLGEEIAIEALKVGATDYVLKTRLSRLAPSVVRALREARGRAERKQADEKLRRSEAYLTEAQRLSQTGSFGCNLSTGEMFWSEETFRIYGYDQSTQPAVERVLQRVHPEDKPLVQEQIEQASRGGKDCHVECRLLLPDDSIKHVRIVAHASKNEPGIIEFIGAVMDVTATKHAEEKLRRSEAYLAEAQILSHTGSFGWNVSSGEIYWSEETYKIFEYDRTAKLTLELVFRRIHPDDRDRVQQTIDRVSGARADFDFEHRLLMPDGSVKYLHVLARALESSSSTLEYLGAVTDVTERKRAEEKIRQSEKELRQVLDLTPEHLSVLAADGSLVYATEVALKYHGLTLDQLKQQPPVAQWRTDEVPLTCFHPDDRERAMRELKDKFLSGCAHETEVRVHRYDGTYRWFHVRRTPLRDEQGRITRWYAAATDIEDRKQAEQRLRDENVALREEIDRASMFEEIVGISPALHAVLSRVSKVAPTDSTVLITGETGTGKELVARAIHRRSHRTSRAFVSVNCAAVPRDLIASELFGHEKGAFTGATQRRLGRFELADGGTIFLDEIGELPAETQIALLRVLQEHEFGRVGGTGSIRTNVRVIAATNRDLEAAIAAGTFRSDLFYRLNVFPIEVPPLREREEDIPVLVDYFIDRYARKAGKSIRGVNKKSLELLQSYPWPGNIRELQNVIERSVIVCDTENFSVDESWLSRQPRATGPKSQLELSQKLASQEKEMIEAALRESGGRVSGPSGAAVNLGIPSSTLYSKIGSLRIDKNRFKSTNPSKNRS
jgi:formate hydrogenlyase transcriptional activator